MTSLTYFTVTADWVPASSVGSLSGIVTFQMLVTEGDGLVAPTLTTPGIVVPITTQGRITNGVLYGLDGNPGVSLLANTSVLNLSSTLYYSVSFADVVYTYQTSSAATQAVNLSGFTFAALTSAATVDLSSVAPAAGALAAQVFSITSAGITDATTLGRELLTAASSGAAAALLGVPAVVNNTDGTLSVNAINTLEPLSTTTIVTTSTAPTIGGTTYYNATSGNLTPPLPALSGLRVGARLAVRRDPADVSLNTVTLTCAGSDTFYSSGGTTATLPMSGEQREYQVISVAGTKYWAPAGSLNPVAALDKRYSFHAAHTLGASFRPLRGTTSAITSSVVSGTVATGVGSIIGWASAYPGSYRFLGMIPGVSGAGATWCQNNNSAPAGYNALYAPITVEFWSNATAISVYFSGQNNDMWAIVDDERIQDGWQHANAGSSGVFTWQLTQTSAVWRKYRLCIGFGFFQGIAINSGANIVATAPAFQLAVVGDSYVSGGVLEANAIAPGVSGTIAAGTLIGELEQITGLEIWRFGIGGTGYVATAGLTGGNYGSTQRVGYFAGLSNQFHACLIYGGVNDWPTSPSTVATAAQAAWTAWAAAHPEMPPLIVTGLQAGGIASAYTGGGNAVNAALKTAALAHPNVGTFIDLLANPYVFGTGYDGTPVGDGNRDVFISADNAHPTHIGWRAAGIDLARKLSQVVLQNTVGV